jgi:hypothetical protein
MVNQEEMEAPRGEIKVPLDEEQKAANEGRATPAQEQAAKNLKQQFVPRMQRKIDEEMVSARQKEIEAEREKIRQRALEARQKYYNPEPSQPAQEEKKSLLDRLFKR